MKFVVGVIIGFLLGALLNPGILIFLFLLATGEVPL